MRHHEGGGLSAVEPGVFRLGFSIDCMGIMAILFGLLPMMKGSP